MVEETIREIRKTEKRADEIVRSAGEESRKIIEEAGKEAAALKEKILHEAREKALQVTEEAQKKAEKPEKKPHRHLTAKSGSLKQTPLREKRRPLNWSSPGRCERNITERRG